MSPLNPFIKNYLDDLVVTKIIPFDPKLRPEGAVRIQVFSKK